MNDRLSGSKINERISGIDREERKKLFNTFVEQGGQVIDQEKKTIVRPVSRPAVKNQTNTAEKEQPNPVKREDRNALLREKILLVDDKSLALEKKQRSYRGWQQFKLRLISWFNGITNFSGREIQGKFSSKTNDFVTNTMAVLKQTADYIGTSPLFLKHDLINTLFTSYPLSTEIIFRFRRWDPEYLSKVFQPNRPYPLSVSRAGFYSMMKYIFPYLGNKELVIHTFKRCLGILKQMPESTNSSDIEARMKKVDKAVEELYQYIQYLTRLYPLLSGFDTPIVSRISKEVLSLEESDFLGTLKEQIKYNVNSLKTNGSNEGSSLEEESLEQETGNQIIDFTREGLTYIAQLGLEERYLSSDIVSYPRRDKIFVAVYLLDFCFSRYSILINRNIFNYKTWQEKGERFALELLLRDFFMNIEKIHISLKNYTRVIASLNAFSSDWSRFTSGEPISQEETNTWSLRGRLATQIQQQIVSFVSELVSALNSKSSYIDRCIVSSDVEINPSFLNGHVFNSYVLLDIFMDFYKYLLGFYYLTTKGALSTSSGMIARDAGLKIIEESEA